MTKINEIIGVDVGSVRVGIARVSLLAKIPEPLLTVPFKEAIPEIKKIIAKYDSNAIVIGLPRDINHNETEQTRFTREWAKNAKEFIELPFFWQDESLTSHSAQQSLKQNKQNTGDIDSLAACVILNDFVNLAESERVEI